jgi:hypothetical protein
MIIYFILNLLIKITNYIIIVLISYYISCTLTNNGITDMYIVELCIVVCFNDILV